MMLWMRAIAFVLFVQLGVVGLIPWLLSSIGPRGAIGPWQYLGLLPIGVGAVVLLHCNWAFVTRGRGTAAPYEPPQALVVSGLYRHVRNPMYASAILIVTGAALWTAAVSVMAYALVLMVAYDRFVRHYEEPKLERMFGASYEEYRRRVPRWVPRLRPGDDDPAQTQLLHPSGAEARRDVLANWQRGRN